MDEWGAHGSEQSHCHQQMASAIVKAQREVSGLCQLLQMVHQGLQLYHEPLHLSAEEGVEKTKVEHSSWTSFFLSFTGNTRPWISLVGSFNQSCSDHPRAGMWQSVSCLCACWTGQWCKAFQPSKIFLLLTKRDFCHSWLLSGLIDCRTWLFRSLGVHAAV